MRMGGRLFFAAAVFLACACSAAPRPRYRVIDLGVLPNGTSSVATALNDKGEVVGDCQTPDGVRAFLFWRGTLTALSWSQKSCRDGNVFTSTESSARDINNRGEVIGNGHYSSGGTVSQFLYSTGVVVYFHAGGYPVIANEI